MSCPMSVRTLLEGWCEDVPELVITGLALDSRRVGRGQAFVAVAGAQAHGMAFARQAESRGAAIVLHDGLAEVPMLGIPALAVPGLGGRLSSLGARFYHNPSERLVVAGVTGTNGKTSTACWIGQMLSKAGRRCAVLGTIGSGFAEETLTASALTTPDAISLQREVLRLLRAGADVRVLDELPGACDRGFSDAEHGVGRGAGQRQLPCGCPGCRRYRGIDGRQGPTR